MRSQPLYVSTPAPTWAQTYDTHLPRSQFHPQHKFSKVDFSRFDGKNVQGWISKANKFFLLNSIMDSVTKVIYAALYLDGEADYWYQIVQPTHPGLTWEAFTTLLLSRFSTGIQGNLIGKFDKLSQTSTVEAYVLQFEELRDYLTSNYPLHTEEFYLSNFLSGLRADI